MNQLIPYLLFFVCLATPCKLCGQVSPKPINSKLLDSLYHVRMVEKYPEYENWKKGLPKRKRKAFLKNTIGGFVFGAFTGVAISKTGVGFCRTITLVPSILAGQDESVCQPQTVKGMLIGGGLGLLVGMTVGQLKAKKLSKFKPTKFY